VGSRGPHLAMIWHICSFARSLPDHGEAGEGRRKHVSKQAVRGRQWQAQALARQDGSRSRPEEAPDHFFVGCSCCIRQRGGSMPYPPCFHIPLCSLITPAPLAHGLSAAERREGCNVGPCRCLGGRPFSSRSWGACLCPCCAGKRCSHEMPFAVVRPAGSVLLPAKAIPIGRGGLARSARGELREAGGKRQPASGVMLIKRSKVSSGGIFLPHRVGL
jgi:hypothetical protein